MYELALERDRRALAPTPLRGRSGGGSPAFVGRVATATSSVALNTYLLAYPVTVLGSESEGGAGSLSADTSTTVPAFLIGPGTPSNGDDVVCRWVGYRWVAQVGVTVECPTSHINFNVRGCGGLALSGATVHVTGPGGFDATITTSPTVFSVPATRNGSYSCTVSKPRFNTVTVTAVVTSCVSPSVTVNLTAATGYVCCSTCPDPIPTVLHASFSGGSCTLTWDATNHWWLGQVAISVSTKPCTTSGGVCTKSTTASTGSCTLTMTMSCRGTGTLAFWFVHLTAFGTQTDWTDDSCLPSPCSGSNVDVVSDAVGDGSCAVPFSQSMSIGSPGEVFSGGFDLGPASIPYLISGTLVVTE